MLLRGRRKAVEARLLCAIGLESVLLSSGATAVTSIAALSPSRRDTRASDKLIGNVKVMLDAYLGRQASTVFTWCSNEFENTMTQTAAGVSQILPLSSDMGEDAGSMIEENARPGSWDYLYEPDAKADPRWPVCHDYIESQVYQACGRKSVHVNRPPV